VSECPLMLSPGGCWLGLGGWLGLRLLGLRGCWVRLVLLMPSPGLLLGLRGSLGLGVRPVLLRDCHWGAAGVEAAGVDATARVVCHRGCCWG
jgi:hypothetical protein